MEEERENSGLNQEETRDELGRFLPGVSGNPEGKPKGVRHITTLVKDALVKIGKTENGEGMKYETALVQKIIHKAIIDGDNAMIKLIWNYLDGMPKQTIEMDDKGLEERKLLKESISKLLNESDTEKKGTGEAGMS